MSAKFRFAGPSVPSLRRVDSVPSCTTLFPCEPSPPSSSVARTPTSTLAMSLASPAHIPRVKRWTNSNATCRRSSPCYWRTAIPPWKRNSSARKASRSWRREPMPKFPVLKPREVCRLLENLGFSLVRQRGSHLQYRHPDGRGTTVPNHSGRDVSPLLVRQIAKDIGLTIDQLLQRD